MSSTFLNIPNVRGESTDPQHQGWIEALSYGYHRHNPNEVWITKTTDSTSGLLFQMAQDGRSFEGEIDVLDNGRIVLQFGLKGAVIAALQLGGRATEDGAIENVQLSCQSVEMKPR